jgi:hypothetical protein
MTSSSNYVKKNPFLESQKCSENWKYGVLKIPKHIMFAEELLHLSAFYPQTTFAFIIVSFLKTQRDIM